MKTNLSQAQDPFAAFLQVLSRFCREGYVPCSLCGALLFFCFQAADAQEEISLRIRKGVEVEIPSAIGKVYELQSSADFKNWISVGDPYFGDGTNIVDVVSYRQTGERQRFFRVKVLNAGEVGIGPVGLSGTAYVFNDGKTVRLLKFQNEATGTLEVGDMNPEPFRYEFTKTGPAQGRLRLLLAADAEEVYEMGFETEEAGAFVCKRLGFLGVGDADAGTFGRVEAGQLSDTSGFLGEAAEAPRSLVGYSFVLSAGGQSNVLKILNEAIIKESMLNRSSSHTYDYTVSGSTGVLTVWKGRENYDHYEFSFSSVCCGSFKRSQFSEGSLRGIEAGAFSVFGVEGGVGTPVLAGAEGPILHFPDGADPSEGDATFSEEPADPGASGGSGDSEDVVCEMPDGLERLCVEVTTGGKTEKLCFYGENTGSLVEPLRGTTIFIPFSYTYSKKGERAARLVVDFSTEQGNDRVVFDLKLGDDCSGSFVRSEYRGGELVGQMTGRFTMRAELVVPDPLRPGQGIIIANPNGLNAQGDAIRTTIRRN